MTNSKKTERSEEILAEILKWTKFLAMEKLRKTIDDVLKSDLKKQIYELSDGRSSPDVAQETGVDESTIRDYWKAWAYLGLAEIHPEYKKRYRKLFSLTELGIDVPKSTKTNSKKENPP